MARVEGRNQWQGHLLPLAIPYENVPEKKQHILRRLDYELSTKLVSSRSKDAQRGHHPFREWCTSSGSLTNERSSGTRLPQRKENAQPPLWLRFPHSIFFVGVVLQQPRVTADRFCSGIRVCAFLKKVDSFSLPRLPQAPSLFRGLVRFFFVHMLL